MLRFVTAVCLIAYAYAGCEPPDKDFHAALCPVKQTLKLDPSTITITPYPPNLSSKLNLSYTITNPGPEIPRFDLSIPKVEWFGEWLGVCGFHKLPLIPITIKCEDLGSKEDCITPTGSSTKHTIIDLTSSAIAKLLALIGGNKYFDLELSFKNGDSVMACVDIKTFLKK